MICVFCGNKAFGGPQFIFHLFDEHEDSMKKMLEMDEASRNAYLGL